MAKNVYIQFARDVRLGEAQYFSRVWYLVPERLLQLYRSRYRALTIDVRDELPEEDAPIGDAIRVEALAEEVEVPAEEVEVPAEEVADDDDATGQPEAIPAEPPAVDDPEADPGA